MENSQGRLFDSGYEGFLLLLGLFMNKIFREEPTQEEEDEIIAYLIDLYTSSFNQEVEFILDNLDLELTEVERRGIYNAVDTSSFARANYSRINEIVQRRKADLIDIREATRDENGAVLIDRARSKAEAIIELIAVSEVQLAVEKASAQSAKLIEAVLGVQLVKVWHAVNDSNTCPVCRRLDGTRVPVTSSFMSGIEESDELYEIVDKYLSYSGGDVPYAHPRCRCWLTIEKA